MSDPAPHDRDAIARFLLPGAGVRGVRVHLDDAWAQIRAHGSDLPAGAAELLGEAAAAAALFTGHAKVDGRLSVQLRGSGALRTLFAECTAAGTLRGIAQVGGGEPPRDLRAMGEGAILAITIENPAGPGREPVRYQGLVPLAAESLAGAFEDYFRQSEQLPTRILLAADERRAAGLMLQKLPGDAGDDDGWARAGALFDTLSAAELLDWPMASLVHRLFHEETPQPLGGRPLRFGCSCSRERVGAMLRSLGREEAEAAMAANGGEVEVRCEFCGQRYEFDPGQIDALFATPEQTVEGPAALQ